jgi:DNA polymerase-3 subunit gamma/tau
VFDDAAQKSLGEFQGDKMAYTALYRRFRPSTFKALIGQNHIGATLARSVERNTFVHAYLLCGPRGTGKTSAAKVLAKAINCLAAQKGEPCSQCEPCLRITGGRSLDVLEIDAASNRGIDEIRDLRERVKYAPAQEKYKVYIIDEVHMLTGEAFNALLKTLEEPPAHVVFILATTEPHKIPLTVLSRCQRFDFRRIPLEYMLEHLASVAAAENIAVTEGALLLMAKKSGGGMRDAINLLDQCSGFSGETIDENAVNNVLGCVDKSFLESTAANILRGDLNQLLCLVDELVLSGKDFRQFLNDLSEYLRDLFLLSLRDEDGRSSSGILKALKALSGADGRLRYSLQPRITLELALIDACSYIPAKEHAPAASPPARTNAPLPPLIRNTPFPKEEENVEEKASPRRYGASPAESRARPDKRENENEENISAAKTEDAAPALFTAAKKAALTSEGAKSPSALSIGDVKNSWPRFLNDFSLAEKSSVAMNQSIPAEINGDTLTVHFPQKIYLDLLNKGDNKDAAEKALSRFYGKALKIKAAIKKSSAEEDGDQISLFD